MGARSARGFPHGALKTDRLVIRPSIAVARRIGMRYVGVAHDWYDEPSEMFISP